MIGFDVLSLFSSTKKIGRLAVIKSDDGLASSENPHSDFVPRDIFTLTRPSSFTEHILGTIGN